MSTKKASRKIARAAEPDVVIGPDGKPRIKKPVKTRPARGTAATAG